MHTQWVTDQRGKADPSRNGTKKSGPLVSAYHGKALIFIYLVS